MRSNPLYYILPSNIGLTANANGHADDIAVYISSGTKIKVYSPAISQLGYADSAFQEWTVSGRNRRLRGGDGKYAIYVRISRPDATSGKNNYKAYLVFSPYVLYEDEWLESHSHLTKDGLSEAYCMGGKNIETDPNYWYVKIGDVSAVENGKRTITLDTGILGTDSWNTEWEIDDVICSQYGQLDTSEDSSSSSDSSSEETEGGVIEVDGDNYDQEYELDGRKARPSAYYNRADPEEGRFQPNMFMDRKTGEFMAARGKFHIFESGDIEIQADRLEMTANEAGSMPTFKLNSANQSQSIVFESVTNQQTYADYVEWFGYAVPVTVQMGGQSVTGDILSLGVRRREDNTGWSRLVLRNVEKSNGVPIAESATLMDNDSIAFYRDSQGWTPQNLEDGAANLRIGIDENGYPYVFSNIGGGPGGLPTEANLADLPVGGLYIDANGFLKVKG